jgi:hypothetical protein
MPSTKILTDCVILTFTAKQIVRHIPYHNDLESLDTRIENFNDYDGHADWRYIV